MNLTQAIGAAVVLLILTVAVVYHPDNRGR